MNEQNATPEMEMEQRVRELEKRVKELEARPPSVVYQFPVVQYPPQIGMPVVPTWWTWPPTITCQTEASK